MPKYLKLTNKLVAQLDEKDMSCSRHEDGNALVEASQMLHDDRIEHFVDRVVRFHVSREILVRIETRLEAEVETEADDLRVEVQLKKNTTRS